MNTTTLSYLDSLVGSSTPFRTNTASHPPAAASTGAINRRRPALLPMPSRSSSKRHSTKGRAPSTVSTIRTVKMTGGGESPLGCLAKDLNSSLNLLDSSATSSNLSQVSILSSSIQDTTPPPPSFEILNTPTNNGHHQQQPQQMTPFLLEPGSSSSSSSSSRKRSMDESASMFSSLDNNSPSPAFWTRKQTRHCSQLVNTETADIESSPFGRGNENNSGLLSTDDEISFDEDEKHLVRPTRYMPNHEQGTPIKVMLANRMRRLQRQHTSVSTIQEEDEEGQVEVCAPKTPTTTPLFDESAGFSPFSPGRTRPEHYQLPCATAPMDSIMRVEAATVCELLNGRYADMYDERIIVDCRFPYEFEGGHIAGATNAPTLDSLEELLLERPPVVDRNRRSVVIFHCEYSIQRAPSMASYLRRRDREVNMHRYPHLHYPEIYVLKGGYRNFFANHKYLCEPQDYVEMNDQQYAKDCQQSMLQFKRQFKRTKSMNDAAAAAAASITPVRRNSNKSVSLLAIHSPIVSPTDMMIRNRPPPSFNSNTMALGGRMGRRLARTQSARPGINNIFNFN